MFVFPNYYFRRKLKDNPEGIVTTSELRELLLGLRDKNPDTCIRFRLIGKMWNESFVNVRIVTDKGVAFENRSVPNQVISISDLTNVMQFELDNSFEEYEPHFHYSVRP
jgi:hypothetical protein